MEQIPRGTSERVNLLIELAGEIGLLREIQKAEDGLNEAQGSLLRRLTRQRNELLELTGIKRALARQQTTDLDLTSDFH